MKQTFIIVVVTALIIEGNHYFLGRRRRKMTARTIMAMTNDLSGLSEKAGYRTWIDYLEKTYGEEKAFSYLNQLYGTLKENKTDDEQFGLLERSLREYLVAASKTLQASK